MCGIAGLIHLDGLRPADPERVRRMMARLTHRGPDEDGLFHRGPIAMGTRRLRVIDLAGGRQPLSNEDGSVWVAFNGEVFNYKTLQDELSGRGHVLRTACDTEVLVHLYEDREDRFVESLDGQFAFALWDDRRRRLVLGRDRLGIRPLFHTTVDRTLYFASEIKALLAIPEVEARLDPQGFEQVFVFCAPAAPRTCFAGIEQLDSGQLMTVSGGDIRRRTYWDLDFPARGEAIHDDGEKAYTSRLTELFQDAVRRQLVADVPVGVYCSGGLDSSILAATARGMAAEPLQTFSIGFPSSYFDESKHARAVAAHLGTQHHEFHCRNEDIVAGLPAAVYFAEHPMLITEMVPLLFLSRLARERVTVILTGEGADEAFGGYKYFRVDKVRRALARFPLSLASPLVRFVASMATGTDVVFPPADTVRRIEAEYGCYPAMFYEFEGGRQLRRMLTAPDLTRDLASYHPGEDLGLDRARVKAWHPFDQSTYFAFKIRLRDHQVSPLGDRATLANSVEGRYPFLDHQLVEFAARLPRHYRLRGFTEKYILRRALGHLLPPRIARRPKQAFMAPFGSALLAGGRGTYVQEMLSSSVTRSKGYFEPRAVEHLVATLRRYDQETPEKVDYERVVAELGLVGVLTTHLFDEIFIRARGKEIGSFIESHPGLPWFHAPDHIARPLAAAGRA